MMTTTNVASSNKNSNIETAYFTKDVLVHIPVE